ncbi:hypothetical protein V8F06_003070 [Rhypophila decipiens]
MSRLLPRGITPVYDFIYLVATLALLVSCSWGSFPVYSIPSSVYILDITRTQDMASSSVFAELLHTFLGDPWRSK